MNRLYKIENLTLNLEEDLLSASPRFFQMEDTLNANFLPVKVTSVITRLTLIQEGLSGVVRLMAVPFRVWMKANLLCSAYTETIAKRN